MYSDLVNKLCNEDTTQSDITYLPSGFSSVIKAVGALGTKKKSWKIEILEDEHERVLNFEGQLTIHVPNEHWTHFVDKVFDGDDFFNHSDNICTVTLKEATDEFDQAMHVLQEELLDSFDEPPMEEMDNDILAFKNSFGIDKYDNIDALVKYQSKEDDLYGILKDIKARNGEDLGTIDNITRSLKKKQPLAMYDPFKRYKLFYGVRIKTTYMKVGIMFQAFVDNNWVISELMYVNDRDVIEVLAEIPTVKVTGNKVHPKGRRFVDGFMQEFKAIIDEVS
jgi:hypothetical protein